MPVDYSLLEMPPLPKHYLQELEAFNIQYSNFSAFGYRRLSPEEERLEAMLEAYRVQFNRWVRRYMDQQWNYAVSPITSYFDRPKDPFHVIPITPLRIPFRYMSFPQAMPLGEGELSMATSTVTLGNVSVWQEWNTLYYQFQMMGEAATAVNSMSNYLTQTVTTAADVWVQWNTHYQQLTGMMSPPVSVVREITPEQQRQMNEQRAQQAEVARLENVKREQERMAAKQKAKELLASSLEKEQKESFEKNGYFDVVVKGRNYRIKPGQMIELWNGKKVECKYCIHPESAAALPSEDIALSQKLLLESSEETFLRIANRHSV